MREVVPTVERTGLDEGYLDVGEVVPGLPRGPRASPQAVQVGGARRPTGLTCSLGVGTCKVVAKVASDRRKPGGIVVVPPGRGSRVPGAVRSGVLPGVGPRAEERLAPRRRATRSADLAALADDELAGSCPGKIGPAAPRPRARASTRAGSGEPVENISISQEETFARDVADREQLHDELGRMSARLAEHARRQRPLRPAP